MWFGSESRRGAVAVLIALMLVVIIGFVSLGTEVVLLLLTAREMQSAADAAALGAVSARLSGSPPDYTQEAFALAAAAGFANGQSAITVSVGSPTSGNYVGATDAVEVLIAQPQTLALANVASPGPFIVRARAVAYLSGEGACLLTLDPSASASLFVHGSATVDLNNCGAFVNSSSPTAVQISGTGSTLCTPIVSVVGGVSGTINPSPPCPPGGSGATTASSTPNPYAAIPTPPAIGCSAFAFGGGSTKTINPGCYQGIQLNTPGKTLNLCPGIYVIENGSFNVQAGTLNSVPGSTAGCSNPTAPNGVTIVLTGSPSSSTGIVTFSGGATINLTGLAAASTSPVMPAGTLFFQDPNAAPSGIDKFNGGATQLLQGVLYFPNQIVQFNGGSGTTSPCTEIVAASVDFGGGTTSLTNTFCPAGTPALGSGQPKLAE